MAAGYSWGLEVARVKASARTPAASHFPSMVSGSPGSGLLRPGSVLGCKIAPRITARVLCLGYRIREVPIRYSALMLREGKELARFHPLIRGTDR